ncbi:type VI secretion system ImpA family N-terminal domain-containing protein [Paraburkholderia sediminicola]|nr:type VI secretion system ImpA family N-terminal domain-containing protein [Paraburkholderia sediminicola]
MAPVDDAAPCGADLEYDPEFVVLSAKVGPKAEAQYGDFVGSPEPVNWNDIERDCRRLMMRSKDMRLAVLFTRCRTRLAGAAGLAEGTGLLAAWLAAFPNAIHPQPGVDVNRDWALEIRMNALQTLTDTDGLLADVREIALTKSTTTRLQLRDVERAFAHPRPGDALAPESVTRQLDDLRVQQPAAMEGFDYALASLEAIETWSREHLDVCAPDLSALIRLLRHLAGRESRDTLANGEERQPMLEPVPSINGAHDAGDPALGESPSACHAGAVDAASGAGRPRGATAVADRHAALDMIREARQWFETYEPSSPIPVLLKRAEQFVGKRYAEIAQAIPPDLLAQWDVQA